MNTTQMIKIHSACAGCAKQYLSLESGRLECQENLGSPCSDFQHYDQLGCFTPSNGEPLRIVDQPTETIVPATHEMVAIVRLYAGMVTIRNVAAVGQRADRRMTAPIFISLANIAELIKQLQELYDSTDEESHGVARAQLQYLTSASQPAKPKASKTKK